VKDDIRSSNCAFRFDAFDKTDECKLFELFDIRLVHGWLYDPEDLEVSLPFTCVYFFLCCCV
jgi:hypothetical protein